MPPLTSLRESIGEDVAGDSQRSLELFEMFEPVQRTSKNEECPFFADQFDGGRKRAAKRRSLECLDIRFNPDDLVTI